MEPPVSEILSVEPLTVNKSVCFRRRLLTYYLRPKHHPNERCRVGKKRPSRKTSSIDIFSIRHNVGFCIIRQLILPSQAKPKLLDWPPLKAPREDRRQLDTRTVSVFDEVQSTPINNSEFIRQK